MTSIGKTLEDLRLENQFLRARLASEQIRVKMARMYGREALAIIDDMVSIHEYGESIANRVAVVRERLGAE